VGYLCFYGIPLQNEKCDYTSQYNQKQVLVVVKL